MSIVTTIAWGGAVAGVFAFVARRVRAAPVHGPSTCAWCGGPPDGRTLHCADCDRDLRRFGLQPHDASLMPRVAVRCMTWTALLPMVLLVLSLAMGMFDFSSTTPRYRSSPAHVVAQGPRSGAYAAVRLSAQFESAFRPEQEVSGGFLILGLEGNDVEPLGTMMALRQEGPWHIETLDGPALDAATLAAWMQGHCPDLDDDDAAREAGDVMSLVAHPQSRSPSLALTIAPLSGFTSVTTPSYFASRSSGGGERVRRLVSTAAALWLAGLLALTVRPVRRPAGAAAALLLAACIAGAGGCERRLMATPNVCVWTDTCSLAAVPGSLRTGTVDVLYATDRIDYGRKRSDELIYGVATVDIAGDLAWGELVVESRKKARRISPVVRIDSKRPLTPSGDQSLLAELARRLAQTPDKEVFLYVHGFNSKFERGPETIAQLWHFAGRRGVPMAYCWPSWPLGAGGGRSYSWDYESSIFTVGHFKHVLELLASCPDLERVTIIAHSRGADVVLSALRELHLAGGGGDPLRTRQQLKLGAVILAAADIETGIMRQRVIAEGVHEIPQRLVVYFSRADWPLQSAEWVTGDSDRVGGSDAPAIAGHGIQLIEARVTGFSRTEHDYFCTHPAASSDLILVMAGHLDIGPDAGRPLAAAGDGTWVITDGYPGLD